MHILNTETRQHFQTHIASPNKINSDNKAPPPTTHNVVFSAAAQDSRTRIQCARVAAHGTRGQATARFELPLMPHQLRALNRCLVIEQYGSILNQDFEHRFDSMSHGSCLADLAGTGKTATSIGLVLSGKEEHDEEQ